MSSKKYAAEIAPILTRIFQYSIVSRTVLSRWKSQMYVVSLKRGKSLTLQITDPHLQPA